MTPPKRVLIFSEANLIKTFVETTVSKIKEETGTRFDCFITTPVSEQIHASLRATFQTVYMTDCPRGLFGKIPKIRVLQIVSCLRRMSNNLPQYDIIHIHFHHFYYAFVAPILRKKARKLFVTFYGGDFDWLSVFRHAMNRRTTSISDGVFAENEKMLEKIIKKYHLDKHNSGVLRFLMANFVSFESFLRQTTRQAQQESWAAGKGIIVCGYSAGHIMRHREMMDALDLINGEFSNYKVIFPMTYGWRAGEMRAMVQQRLASSQYDAEVIEEFLPVEKLHSLRLAADIFINIQVRDQLSSSMMEHLAAGSIVITGTWFPYGTLIEKGVFFVQINKPSELAEALAHVLRNIEEFRKRSEVNREIILNMTNWEVVKKNWYEQYELN